MTTFLAYIFYFIAASASPLQRRWLAVTKPADAKDQAAFAFRITLIIACLGSLTLPFIETPYISSNLFNIVFLALICGVCGVFFWIISYAVQKHVEAGVYSVIANVYTPVTIIGSSFFLAEGLKPIQILGTIILLVAAIIVSKKHRMGRFKFDKYFILSIASGVALGLLLISERALQKETGWTSGTLITWWSECLFLGITTLVLKSKHSYSLKDVGITGVLRFLQQLSWVILLLVVGNQSLVAGVTTFKVVIIFIAAAIFLKEREDLPRKIFGSLIAVVGLLLMR